ncbi:TPR repeat-containing protein [Shimia aestuarii]|uniref:TPR repeat-containing protein n=2 Tax=Shimia aestuarii TaxID=254406 RepID=A0A1I4LWE9_9RHOB|nr:TPR repeat-containing protein [Shimia aestuarii]
MIYVMVNLMRYLKPVVTACSLSAIFLQPSVVFSQQGALVDEDVPALLLQLRDAEPGQAETIAERVRRAWSLSGSASADYLLRRGRKAMELGDAATAVEHFTALVDHAPGFAQGWAERARAYFALDLYGPAVGDLEQALALNPDHFESIMGLAVILDSMGRNADAYEAYLQVKAIHPHQPGLTEALTRLEPLVRGSEL